MPTFSSSLLSRQEIADGTFAFKLSKPTDFTFKPGQHIDLTLINPPETDAEGNSRTVSLVSAPHESELMVATRWRDTAFKRTLKIAPIGTPVEIEGAYGSMTLHSDTSRPAIFLAGGIGITPFMSMIRHAAYEKLPHHISLFFSNQTPEVAPFLQELTDLQQQNPNYQLIATMTNMPESTQTWTGQTGYIDAPLLQKYVNNFTQPIFYMAGPNTMISAMETLLKQLHVPDDNIRSEEFAGY